MAQLALSLTLLFCAGLFYRAAHTAARIDPGFAPSGDLVAERDYALSDYDAARVRASMIGIGERLRTLSAVRACLDALQARPAKKNPSYEVLMPFGVLAADTADLLERLELVGDSFLSVGTPIQVALADILAGGAVVREQIQRRLAANLTALRRLVDAAPAIRLLEPAGGWTAVVGAEDLGLARRPSRTGCCRWSRRRRAWSPRRACWVWAPYPVGRAPGEGGGVAGGALRGPDGSRGAAGVPLRAPTGTPRARSRTPRSAEPPAGGSRSRRTSACR